MVITEVCPRCRGTLTRVQDIGDVYHSCVQCGHVIYGAVPEPATEALHAVEARQWPEATDRVAVRRRQIRRAKELAARKAA